MYAVAAKGDDGNAALLISNISDKRDRKLKIDAGEYTVDKVMTVNENCEWVETEPPKKSKAVQYCISLLKNNKLSYAKDGFEALFFKAILIYIGFTFFLLLLP